MLAVVDSVKSCCRGEK